VKGYEQDLDAIRPRLLEPCEPLTLPPSAEAQQPGADAAPTPPPGNGGEAGTDGVGRPELLGRQAWAVAAARQATDNFKRVAGRPAVVTAKSKELQQAKGKYDSNLHADTGDSDLALISLITVARLAYRLGVEEQRFAPYVDDLDGDHQRFVSADEYREQLESCYQQVNQAKEAVLKVNDTVLTRNDKDAEDQQKLAVLRADPLAEILRRADRDSTASAAGGGTTGTPGSNPDPSTAYQSATGPDETKPDPSSKAD